MIPGTHAVVTERTGFMARLPPAGVILQAHGAGGQANQLFPKAHYHSTTSDEDERIGGPLDCGQEKLERSCVEPRRLLVWRR